MSVLRLSRSADVIDAALAREILWRCGYGARREGDDIVVYPERNTSSLYVRLDRDGDEEIESISHLVTDEGHQQDCLRADGTVGSNMPWIEMCDMNALLRLIVKRYDPKREYDRSPYMGRGSSARFMHSQYCIALDDLMGNSDEFRVEFEWPPPPPSEVTMGE